MWTHLLQWKQVQADQSNPTTAMLLTLQWPVINQLLTIYWPICATPSWCRGIYGRLWLQEARLSSNLSYPHWIQRHDNGLAADVLGCLAADRTPQLEKRQLWYSIMSWKMKLTCQGLIESPAMASHCSGPDKCETGLVLFSAQAVLMSQNSHDFARCNGLFGISIKALMAVTDLDEMQHWCTLDGGPQVGLRW